MTLAYRRTTPNDPAMKTTTLHPSAAAAWGLVHGLAKQTIRGGHCDEVIM